MHCFHLATSNAYSASGRVLVPAPTMTVLECWVSRALPNENGRAGEPSYNYRDVREMGKPPSFFKRFCREYFSRPYSPRFASALKEMGEMLPVITTSYALGTGRN